MNRMAAVTVDELFEQAMALDVEDRLELLDRLRAELVEEVPLDPEIDAAWADEIRQRIERHDRGETETIDFRTAMGEMRAELKKRREARTP